MTAKGNTRCWFWLLALASYGAVTGFASAQDIVPEQDIRRDAQQILQEPEFQYFEHLGDSPDRPESRGGRRQSAFGSRHGGSGGERGGNRSSGGSSSRSRARSGDDRNNSSSSSSDGSGSSSTFSRLGSGLSAISGVIGMIFHALAYLVLIAVCGLIMFLIVQAILSRESTQTEVHPPLMNFDLPQEEEHPPGELPADAYLEHAHTLARQGRFREAVGQLLWGGMSSIERAELIRHRRGLTLRDYLRSLRGRPPHYDGFQSMIRLYEPIGFGRRIASHQTFQDALSGYQQAVEGLA